MGSSVFLSRYESDYTVQDGAGRDMVDAYKGAASQPISPHESDIAESSCG